MSKIERLPPFQSKQPSEPLINVNPAELLRDALGSGDSWKKQRLRETITGETKIGNPTSHNPNSSREPSLRAISTFPLSPATLPQGDWKGQQFREDPVPAQKGASHLTDPNIFGVRQKTREWSPR